MKQLLLAILVMLSSLSGFAQKTTHSESTPKKERTLTLWGHIRDSFTKVGVKDVKITLMNADSTIVDTCTAWRNGYQSNDFCYRFEIPAKPASYIVRATHPEYYDTYVNYTVKYAGRNRYFDAPWHYMKRRSYINDFEGGVLGEVIVKATRVKIAYRGDTIVYDASAFKLPDGSMLDALVRQLPGAELKDDGSILINGRKVDYLTLNGKDFFKGQNKIMLDNLPYYTVKDIKVYNRTTDFSKYMGKDMEQKEYVMDVNLKKEYSTGYLANLEAGLAPSNRHLERVFVSRFSDHTKVTAYANVNNINETRNPESNGEWRATDAPEGKTTNRSVGLNIQSDGTDTWYKNAFEANAFWNDYTNNNSVQGTRFMGEGNSYSLTDSHDKTRSRQIQFSNDFSLQLPVWINSYTVFRLNDTDFDETSRSASLTGSTDRYGEAPAALDSIFSASQPLGIRESLLNRICDNNLYHGKQLYAYQKFFYNQKLPWGDNLEWELNGLYNHRDNKSYSDYRLDYNNQEQQKDYRNIYDYSRYKGYRWEARAEYYINALNNWTWRIYTLFNQENNNTPREYYRLDKLKEWQNGMHPLGEIPSTADSLLMALSWDDSEYTNRMTRNSQSGLHFYYNKQTDSTYAWIRFHLPIFVRNEKITYQHAMVDTCATRSRILLDGNINTTFAWKKWKRVINAHFWHNTILPDLYNSVGFNYSNPLSIVLANADLKTGHKWRTRLGYEHKLKDNRTSFNIGSEYWYQSNPVVTGYRYNRQTGAYIYQAQNADGAWNANLEASMSGALDKKQRWTFTFYNQIIWEGSQVMELASNEEVSQLYDLRSLNYNASFNLYYRNGDFTTGINGDYQYRNTHYQQGIRNNYHSQIGNLSYAANYTIPVLKLFIGTTFAWNHLENSLSNVPTQNYYVWNGFISRSFLKNKQLTAKLTAYDLLNSVSIYSYNHYDNMFSTEIKDRIGRYVMLTLSYKININPKRS